MSTHSTFGDSSEFPYHLSFVSGAPSFDGGSQTPGPISRPSSILKPSVSCRTHSKIVVVDPLEATIAPRCSNSPPKSIFFDRALNNPNLVDVNSATEDDEVMSPLEPISRVEDDANIPLVGEQPFYDNYEEDEDVEVTFRVPYCENMDSSMNDERLEKLLETCYPGSRLVILKAGERCHRFDSLEIGFPIPYAVVLASFFKLGFSLPMHPFFLEILDFYRLAPCS